MQIGAFGKIADYDRAHEAGFDYIELDLPEIADLSEEEYQAFKKHVEEVGFPASVGSRVLPVGEALIFKEGFDKEDWRDYFEKSCARSSGIGVKKVLFGNGKARALQKPEDADRGEIFLDFIKMLAEICLKNGQELVLEPLGPEYSNYINTLPQAVECLKKVNMPNFVTMIDLRHAVRGHEPYEDIVSCAEFIHHVHIDYPGTWPERYFPSVEDNFDYSPFFRALRDGHLDDQMTVEADVPDDWDAAFAKIKNVMAVYA